MLPGLPERTMSSEAEMREFFTRCGLSAPIIERAIKVRYFTPPEEQYVDGRGRRSRKAAKPGRTPTKK